MFNPKALVVMLVIAVSLIVNSVFAIEPDSILVIFESTGAGGVSEGWVDDGTIVRLATETDSVGIGTATPAGLFHIYGGGTSGTPQTPGIDNFVGTINRTTADYNLGYKFTPNRNGQITRLWARVGDNLPHTIRLYNSDGDVIASAVVDGIDEEWVGADITPVNVTAGDWYVVAVRSGSGGTFLHQLLNHPDYMPFTVGDITINESRHLSATDGIPTNVETQNMYGQADITFVPIEGETNFVIANTNVGIGITDPLEKLDIDGRIRMSSQTEPIPTTDRLYNTGGDLFWNGAQLTGGGGILPTGTSGQTLRHTGSGWSAVDNLYNDGTNVGIGTSTPISLLHLKGTTWTNLAIETPDNDPSLQLTSDGSTPNNDWTMRMDASIGDNLEFRYDGLSKMTLNTDGDLGIWVNPLAKLDIADSDELKALFRSVGGNSIPASIELRGTNTDGSASQEVIFKSYQPSGTGGADAALDINVRKNGDSFGSPSTKMTIRGDTGNIGIGTTNPLAKFDINPGIAGTASISNLASDAAIFLDAVQTGTYRAIIGLGERGHTLNTAIGSYDAGSEGAQGLWFATGNNTTLTEAMRITNAGRVGIGTASPDVMLHLYGAAAIRLQQTTREPVEILGEGDGTGSTLRLRYHNGSGLTDGIRINSSGNVGIGTSSPMGKLHIQDGKLILRSNTINYLEFHETNSHGTLYRWRMNNTESNGGLVDFQIRSAWTDAVMHFKYNGRIGIGTTDPGSYKLYVNGSAYSTGGWSSSDINLKKNIQPLSNVLPKLENIQGVKFDWRKEKFPDKGFDDRTQIGLIAQDVEKVFPELVNQDNEGYKALSYDGFIGVLLQAIKEQQSLIQELKNENTEQQIRIEKLEDIIQK